MGRTAGCWGVATVMGQEAGASHHWDAGWMDLPCWRAALYTSTCHCGINGWGEKKLGCMSPRVHDPLLLHVQYTEQCLGWNAEMFMHSGVLFWCLFPVLLRNTGNKHQNNTQVSAKQFIMTVHPLFYYLVLHDIMNPWMTSRKTTFTCRWVSARKT